MKLGRSKGFYVMFKFNAPTTVPNELERAYNIDERVIKYMTVVEKKHKIVAPKESTDPRAESSAPKEATEAKAEVKTEASATEATPAAAE